MQIDDPDKEDDHHGHSHGDGKIPKTVLSVAWMVIIGDGLHNFSDGLAIGINITTVRTTIKCSLGIKLTLPHDMG